MFFYANYVGSSPVPRYFQFPDLSHQFIVEFERAQENYAWPAWDTFLSLRSLPLDTALWAGLLLIFLAELFDLARTASTNTNQYLGGR